MKKFTITRLEERIAPTITPGEGIFHDPCPPGLDIAVQNNTPLVVVSDGCTGCTMWNENAASPSRVFIN